MLTSLLVEFAVAECRHEQDRKFDFRTAQGSRDLDRVEPWHANVGQERLHVEEIKRTMDSLAASAPHVSDSV
ncbi:MAG TPA: hypothetical protein VKP30_20245 [Polyangiaceae bacterium]|nr:hypothetical protein [Polyangiaceae bacterium]